VKYGSLRCVEANKNERWCWGRLAGGGMRRNAQWSVFETPRSLGRVQHAPVANPALLLFVPRRCAVSCARGGAREVLSTAACHVQQRKQEAAKMGRRRGQQRRGANEDIDTRQRSDVQFEAELCGSGLGRESRLPASAAQ
jgi:hypothetical protein